MKRIAFLLLFLLFAQAALAVSANSNRSVYFKGQEIGLDGDCTPDETVSVSAVAGRVPVFSDVLQCPAAGQFTYFYQTDFLVPSGKWTVTVGEGTKTETVSFDVKAENESLYYLISFQSPPPNVRYARTEQIKVSVRVTDAGEPLEDATVVYWDAKGKRVNMLGGGDGVYSANYRIPVDAPLGNWPLKVAALTESGGETRGGENELLIVISPALLAINIASPTVKNFDLESVIPIEATVAYASGEEIDNVKKFVAVIKGKEHELLQDADGLYKYAYKTAESDLGDLAIELVATDAGGNEVKETLNVVVTFDPVATFWKKYFLFIVAGIVVAAFALFFAHRRVKGTLDRNALLQEKVKLKAALEKLQTDYYDKLSMSKSAFTQRQNEIQQRLREIEKRLQVGE